MDTKTLQKLFFMSLSILLVFFHVCPADAADWTIVRVDDGDVGWYTSIALDNDNPRISYHEGINADLQYTSCNADCDDPTNWGSIIVDSSGDVGRHSSLYDSSGSSHISYYDETTVNDGDLKYATCSSGCDAPGNWTPETVDSTDDVGLDTSLALDGLGNPHISYFDNTRLNLKYAYKSGGSWNIVTVDSSGTVGEYTSLALDNGKPRISYHGNSTLKYASCDTGCNDTGNWTVITVENRACSIAGTACSSDAGCPTGESCSDVGEYTSLALDSTGAPRISYANFPTPTNGNLKYAICDSGCDTPGNWTTIALDRSGNTGWDTSLAFTDADNPRIAYYRANSGDLKYAWCDMTCATTANWNTETVDTIDDVGEFASLAIDSNNDPHISYYDYDNEDLKYAHFSDPCLANEDCNDNNDCTDDTCTILTGECVFTPNTNSCDDGLFCTLTDQCSGGSCVGTGDPCDPSQLCVEGTGCVNDSDDDGVFDNTDNCIDTANPGQEDTYPLGGNSCGDACECEGDFTPDGDVDGEDLTLFLADFGRGQYDRPCENGNTCNGDFLCDADVDSEDVTKFLEDFGRGQYDRPCPPCSGYTCSY